jgi:hypothetical protein
MSVIAMGIFRFFVCLFLLLLSSASFAVDTDRDGLPDAWEIENGRDPLVADFSLSSGYQHACSLINSELYCWGDNEYGQTSVPNIENPIAIAAGWRHYFALCLWTARRKLS